MQDNKDALFCANHMYASGGEIHQNSHEVRRACAALAWISVSGGKRRTSGAVSLVLTSRRITAPECRTVYLVSMLQEAAAIYCMYTDEVVSDTPRRPCRTAHCDLCSLAPNEPHWQAALRLYVSFSLNETINTPWSDLQSDVTTLATCLASSGFITAFLL